MKNTKSRSQVHNQYLKLRPDLTGDFHKSLLKVVLVQVWLEKMFGDKTVPAYELNQFTVGILHGQMTRNVRHEADKQLFIEDLRQKAEEYSSENARLENLLQSMHLSSASLSQSGIMSLRTLANLALTLQIRDASDTSYLLALQYLESELNRVEDSREDELRTLSSLLEKTKLSAIKQSHLKKALSDLEQQDAKDQPAVEKNARETSFIRNKAKEYKTQIEKLQVHLDKLGADPSIYHQTLLQRTEELQKLKDEIEPMKQKLDLYFGLPPDTIQAHVQLEEMRERVSSLEAELKKKIDVHVLT